MRRSRSLVTLSVAVGIGASLLLVAPAPASADPALSTTQLTVCNAAPLYGSVVILQAQVTGVGVPTGTVTFLDGTKLLGGAPLDATGLAQFPISTLSIGSHNVVASYAGDAANAAGSSDPVTVSAYQRTKTDLLIYSRPKAPGATWTPTTPLVLVANVIKASPVGTKLAPTGTVTFSLDGVTTILPVVGLHDTALDLPNGLPLGTHVAIAHYTGDANFAKSFSPTRTFKVKRNLTTSIVDSPDPVDCLLGTLAIHASRAATLVVQTPSSPPSSGAIVDTATALLGMNNLASESTSVVPRRVGCG